MPSKTKSFQYVTNQLPIETNQHEYHNALVGRYQDTRKAYMNQTGGLDDKQLVKERYTDYPTFISSNDINSTHMVFANRGNGYFAYTDQLNKSKETPFYHFTFETVESYPEYLARVHNTPLQGFFLLNSQLSCYAEILSNDIKVVLSDRSYSMLYFCDSYTYTEAVDAATGRIGKLSLISPYFTTKTLDVYSKDSVTKLEKYTIYSKISNKDPHPTEKIPGEPIYKTIVITGVDSNVKKIKIKELEINLTSDANKVLTFKDDRFNDEYVGVKYIGNGELEIGFCLPFKPDPLKEVSFPISLLVGSDWTEEKTCVIYFKNNHIQSLTTTLTVDDKDKYLDVPSDYTLRVENRYFFSNPATQKTTDMFYLEEEKTIPLTYKGLVSNRYVFNTDSVTVHVEKGKIPGEYTFKLKDTYNKVNGFSIPVWVYGYTSGEIRPIPDDFIQITPTLRSPFSYTEYGKGEYVFEFAHSGTVTLVEVGLKSVGDDYGYLSSDDFTFTKITETTGKMTYKLTLDKKIFINPSDITTLPVRLSFKYTVKRKDASLLNWPAETIRKELKLTYVKDRWEIINVNIDNILLGDATISYQIRDKLLNKITDKFSNDERLSPIGKTIYSNNVERYFDSSDWDIRTKIWQDSINIKTFGDITLQFKGVVAQSNIYTIKHDEPVHPLVVTPHPATINMNTVSRIKVDFKYKEGITDIYVNGSYLSNGTPIKLDNVKDGYGLLFPLYTGDKKSIIGMGIDLTPLKEGDIPVSLIFNEVNGYDYTKWPIKSEFNITVKQQPFNFTFKLTDFSFDKNSTGLLSLNDNLLADGRVVAVVRNASNEVVVAKPNFNPIGNGDFETTNLFIDGYLSSQVNYYLDIEVYEYANASKNNDLPNQLYYSTRIAFKVK